jgi:hypothetical protein
MDTRIEQLEARLKTQGQQSLVAPPARLRYRTLAALRETEQLQPQPRNAKPWRALLAMWVMATIVCVIAMQLQTSTPRFKGPQPRVTMTPVKLPSVSELASALRTHDPLRNEAREIVRHAERTATILRASFTRGSRGSDQKRSNPATNPDGA